MPGSTEAKPDSTPIVAGPLSRQATDEAAGFEILPDFEPFDQKNELFRRSWWDPEIRNEKSERFYATYRDLLRGCRRAEGFNQRDYALRNAAWHVSDIFSELKEPEGRREGFTDVFTLQREVASERTELGSPEEAAADIKLVAKCFGADLVGITQFDERWQYVQKFSDVTLKGGPPEIPAALNHVIVVAKAMHNEWIETTPSAVSGAASGLGYSQDAFMLLTITQYIRNLGYQAIASMNDSSLAIPYAIQAGLGEYGRSGLLITREYGPHVRLGKIYTDLPLALDQPIRFGVKEFCTICRRCTQSCPVKAIAFDEPTAGGHSHSNIQGVRKWSIQAEKCFGFWAAQNSDCTICLRVCPYNKDYARPHYRLGRRLAGTPLRRFMLWLDIRLGYGDRLPSHSWWRGQKKRSLSRLRRLLPGGGHKSSRAGYLNQNR